MLLEETLLTIPQFPKFQYILKLSLQETPSTIPKNWIYLKRHFLQFHKILYVLKIVEMILKLKMSLFNINSNFSTVYENCGKCLLKRHF